MPLLDSSPSNKSRPRQVTVKSYRIRLSHTCPSPCTFTTKATGEETRPRFISFSLLSFFTTLTRRPFFLFPLYLITLSDTGFLFNIHRRRLHLASLSIYLTRNMSLKLGDLFPNFELNTTVGKIHLHDWLADAYLSTRRSDTHTHVSRLTLGGASSSHIRPTTHRCALQNSLAPLNWHQNSPSETRNSLASPVTPSTTITVGSKFVLSSSPFLVTACTVHAGPSSLCR